MAIQRCYNVKMLLLRCFEYLYQFLVSVRKFIQCELASYNQTGIAIFVCCVRASRGVDNFFEVGGGGTQEM